MPMDLNTIDWTTMNEAKLRSILSELGINPPDELRATIYLRILVNAKISLNHLADDRDIGKNTICPVETALRSNTLMGDLSEILDDFVAMTISKNMEDFFKIPANNVYNYSGYFEKTFFEGNFDNNVRAFLGTYPITSHALTRLKDNFLNNIQEACTRIIRDIGDIQTLFQDSNSGIRFQMLSQIKSTGSDFHKGGKQVLKLFFKTSTGNFKLIYKPGDMEFDCLIAGKSAAVNKVYPEGFMNSSLVEILNEAIIAEKNAHPDLPLEVIPTYHILPKDPTSRSPVDPDAGHPLPIRGAYGYIEYLEHEFLEDTRYAARIKIWGWRPFDYGKNDFLILDSIRGEQYPQKFYNLLGEWTAIACIFSIYDLHTENIIAHNFKPYLIDMEVSFYKVINTVQDTVLISNQGDPDPENIGGINGELGGPKNIYIIHDRPKPVSIERDVRREEKQNRLKERSAGGITSTVPIDWRNLIAGYNSIMDILKTIVREDKLIPWLLRLDRVLVRVVPYRTDELNVIIDAIYRMGFKTELDATIRDTVSGKYHGDGKNYTDGNIPKFIIWRGNEEHGTINEDLNGVDIPTFYNRIGTNNILDSNGRPINIPEDIDIPAFEGDPGFTKHIGRTSYFPVIPKDEIVAQRINALRDDAQYQTIKTLFEGQLRTYSGIAPIAP